MAEAAHQPVAQALHGLHEDDEQQHDGQHHLGQEALVAIADAQVAQATAAEADVIWRKGQEAGVKRIGAPASLRGLVPSRLAAADYREGSALDLIVKGLIGRIAITAGTLAAV